MKFKVGDTVLVTAGKDKGKTSKIIAVLPEKDRVVVEGVNLYTRHLKPFMGRPGEKVRKERALPTANVAIVNEKGQPDRIGYTVTKSGKKTRVFKKTGSAVDAAATKAAPKKTEKKAAKKEDKKETKKK